MTIFGTRPEVIKLFPILEKLKGKGEFNTLVVSVSQHREMIDDLLTPFDLQIDHDLDIIQQDQSLVDITIRALAGLDPLLKRHRPDLVLVMGDTTSAFIAALAAFYHRIPVGHVEAGLRSSDKNKPYPEEVNRRMISTLSDLHFAPTAQNAEQLIREGADPEQIYVTGNTVIDCLHMMIDGNRSTLKKYLPHDTLNAPKLVLVTAHRRENWGEPLENLCLALKDLIQRHPDVHVVYPVHLNPNVRKTVVPMLSGHERIHLLDPLPYKAFVEAMIRSYFIITDSGGIQEEALSLGKPVLVFREVTERREGLETGGLKLVGVDRENVMRSASMLLEDPVSYEAMIAECNPYGDGQAAGRIVKAIKYYFGSAGRPEDFETPIHIRWRKKQAMHFAPDITHSEIHH